MKPSPIISVEHLTKVYQSGGDDLVVLDDINIRINRGEFVAIMGPSGSGKSTFMHILGALDVPTKGKYILDNLNVGELSDDELADIRNRKIGFVFQAFNLLPRTTALDNVILPMEYAGVPDNEQKPHAEKLLQTVGLGDRMDHTPAELSGGQQQRVAIARALVMNPAIILADEPTGNIASAQADEVMSIFEHLNDDGHTIIMITHEPDIAEHAKRIIHLKDGKIVSDGNSHARRRVTKKASI
jgi:putative ABC transport system ATP-binding protein